MKRLLALSIAALSLLAGCNKNENDPVKEQSRTVIVYFISDNNLYDDAIDDINEMESAWDDSYNGNLLVFLNTINGTNVLYHIRKGTNPYEIESDIVKMYSTGSHVCSKEFLNQVISDAMKLYPADSYALDLWSHGSSWLPDGMMYPLYHSSTSVNKEKPTSSTFGQDDTNNECFEVNDLADALSMYNFDFIIMDACHMGSIECAYQLRNCCDYYIASAAETLVDGFPYDEIMPDMFSFPANTVGIAQKYYEYYDALTGDSRTATISVVETENLEQVAQELSDIVTTPATISTDNVQQYGRWITGLYDCFFDLQDFVVKTWGESRSSAFSSALSRAVIYKANTPMILGDIEVNTFCGLSSYIPLESQPVTYSQFSGYDWAIDSGLADLY